MSVDIPDSKTLIAAVNYATDSLGLYRAELARILCLKCGDVSDSRYLEKLLNDDKNVQHIALRFLEFYRLVEQQFDDNVAILHWFRKDHEALDTSPFLAMVDDGRLEDVIIVLSKSGS